MCMCKCILSVFMHKCVHMCVFFRWTKNDRNLPSTAAPVHATNEKLQLIAVRTPSLVPKKSNEKPVV